MIRCQLLTCMFVITLCLGCGSKPQANPAPGPMAAPIAPPVTAPAVNASAPAAETPAPMPATEKKTERVTLTKVEKPANVTFKTIDLMLDGTPATIEIPESASLKKQSEFASFAAEILGGDRFGLKVGEAKTAGLAYANKYLEEYIRDLPPAAKSDSHKLVDTGDAVVTELYSKLDEKKPYVRIMTMERKIGDKTYGIGPALKIGLQFSELTQEEALLVFYCASTLKAKTP